MLVRRKKNNWRYHLPRLALIITPVTIVFIIGLAYNNLKPIEVVYAPITTSAKNETIINLPLRLKIPVINVDAVIYNTGLAANGAMDIKQDPDKTAWYSLGPRPGENGSAVIAGHYGWDWNGQGSVFNELHNLNKGDKIATVDILGIATNFIVRDIKRYDPDADAYNVFISNDGKSHLNLVTCGGTWDDNKATYSERLVVFADKEIDQP